MTATRPMWPPTCRTFATAALLALVLCAPGAAAQGRLTPAGSLATARTNHTATLLADGRVLIAGGRAADGLTSLASTELFDPKTKRWTAGASMAVGRSQHTATLLEDGRVLVAGGTTHESGEGQNRFVALASAELYDPKANRWTALPPMGDARNGHTATLLKDGSVLIAGGAREQRAHLASVERFDPEKPGFTPLRPLAIARWLHEAARLSDGSVVVLGGRSNQSAGAGAGAAIADVERFDPSNGVWHTVPPMSESRHRTAVVTSADTVMVIGGQTALSTTNYVESWEPGAESWRLAENHLSMALVGHTATRLPNGDVLVIGGEPPNEVDTARAQLLQAKTKRWCLAGELSTSRKSHTATLLPGGAVLVVGGTSAGMAEPSAELWAPAPGKCEEPPGLQTAW